MRVKLSGLKILGAFAAMMLVAACETSSDQSGRTSSFGASTGGAGVATDSVQSGTQQDFAVNVGDRVQFGYDRYQLSAEARGIIERQAAWLKSNSSVKVVVEGHCDERGTREYNLALGERRASSVVSYMIALGVEESRISTISYGKERPIAFGSVSADWAKNRRSVTIVQ